MLFIILANKSLSYMKIQENTAIKPPGLVPYFTPFSSKNRGCCKISATALLLA